MRPFLPANRYRLLPAVLRQSLRAPRPGLSVAALFCATVAAILTVDARRHPVAPFDQAAIDAIQRVQLPYLQQPVDLVNALTNSFWAPVIWMGVLLALLAARWFVPALAVALMPAGGFINNVLGVYVVIRTRPDADQIARTVGDSDAPSYPSGHVMGAVMLYGLLLYLAPRVPSMVVRVIVTSMAITMIVTVGFARLWVGAHWPSDVLAAYAMGGLVVVLLIAGLEQAERTVAYLGHHRVAPGWRAGRLIRR